MPAVRTSGSLVGRMRGSKGVEMLRMKPTTQLRLDHNARSLMREFAHLTGEDVIGEFEQVTQALMAGARFDDYVPILAYRFARDRLRDKPAQQVMYIAA